MHGPFPARGLARPPAGRRTGARPPSVLVAAVVAALALVLTIVVANIALGAERVAVGALILPVILVAAAHSVRWTCALAVLAVVAAVLSVTVVPPTGDSPAALRIGVLAVGALACVWGANRGATARRAVQAVQVAEQRYRTVLETADEGIGVLDEGGRVVFVNSRLADILGYPVDEMLGRHVLELVDPDDRDAFRTRVARYRAGRNRRHELVHRRPDGGQVTLLVSGRFLVDDDGRATELVGFYTDITDRRRAEEEIERLALHDELTGLANRALLRDRLAHELSRRDRPGLAVLLLDLDQFKAVNDSLGHDAGDQLLTEVARRLQEIVRPFDTVARLGGDEFALVCPDVEDPTAARAIADRVERCLAEPVELAELSTTATASIGMALAPAGAVVDGPEQLLREADAAMYAAKDKGRARAELYEPTMGARASDRLRVLTELRSGLARDELLLHYQPIVDVDTGAVRGVESLVRWQHPRRGLLLPGQFLPVAEESGLLVDVGSWVLQEAFRQGALWHRDQPLLVSVNLSVRQLLHRGLVEQVRRLLDETGFPADHLTLEVTETALIADLGAASTVLDQLRGLGVRLALDDFGTGYSSLAYLRHLPVDELKLDRSFLVDLERPQSTAVVSAVIDVAHALDMTVVGEGVERPEQLEALSALGCDLAQGYLCGRPAAPADLVRT